MTAAAEIKSVIENAIKPLSDKLDKGVDRVEKLEKLANTPVYKGLTPSQLFHATSGPIGNDSQPYSILRAAGMAKGWYNTDQCKVERDTHEKLRKWYKSYGFQPHHEAGSFIVPFSTAHMPPPENSEEEKILSEVKGRIKAYDQSKFDPEEAEWAYRKAGMGDYYRKALGTISDLAGGVMVGFPTLGELIDLQRNLEAFARAGASEIGLPPNGRFQYPKLTGGATAGWIGESLPITESQQATGSLDLVAKKLGVFVKLNNELLRFTSPSTEGMVRMDMARVAALKLDLGMLEGTGGLQIKGLTTYPSASSWTPNTDPLLVIVAGTTGANGDTLLPTDVYKAINTLPDMVAEPTGWIIRREMWAGILNFRADAVSAADAKGQFLFSQMRTLNEKMIEQLGGYPVYKTSQISNTRVKGAGVNLTYVIVGYFPDWVTGRFGVMEFLASGLGDTALQNDQTFLRGIQHVDAGPRHASSFVMIDSLLVP